MNHAQTISVEVEHCIDCSYHSWCSRHDEAKYADHFDRLKASVLQSFPSAKINRNVIPSHLKKIINHSIPKQNKYHDQVTNKLVQFPRLGSFEVYIDGMLVFSKLKANLWPKVEKLTYLLECIVKEKQNGGDIKKFSLDYRLDHDHDQDENFIDTYKNVLMNKKSNVIIRNRSQFQARSRVQETPIKRSFITRKMHTSVKKRRQEPDDLVRSRNLDFYYSRELQRPSSKRGKTSKQQRANKFKHFQDYEDEVLLLKNQFNDGKVDNFVIQDWKNQNSGSPNLFNSKIQRGNKKLGINQNVIKFQSVSYGNQKKEILPKKTSNRLVIKRELQKPEQDKSVKVPSSYVQKANIRGLNKKVQQEPQSIKKDSIKKQVHTAEKVPPKEAWKQQKHQLKVNKQIKQANKVEETKEKRQEFPSNIKVTKQQIKQVKNSNRKIQEIPSNKNLVNQQVKPVDQFLEQFQQLTEKKNKQQKSAKSIASMKRRKIYSRPSSHKQSENQVFQQNPQFLVNQNKIEDKYFKKTQTIQKEHKNISQHQIPDQVQQTKKIQENYLQREQKNGLKSQKNQLKSQKNQLNSQKVELKSQKNQLKSQKDQWRSISKDQWQAEYKDEQKSDQKNEQESEKDIWKFEQKNDWIPKQKNEQKSEQKYEWQAEYKNEKQSEQKNAHWQQFIIDQQQTGDKAIPKNMDSEWKQEKIENKNATEKSKKNVEQNTKVIKQRQVQKQLLEEDIKQQNNETEKQKGNISNRESQNKQKADKNEYAQQFEQDIKQQTAGKEKSNKDVKQSSQKQEKLKRQRQLEDQYQGNDFEGNKLQKYKPQQKDAQVYEEQFEQDKDKSIHDEQMEKQEEAIQQEPSKEIVQISRKNIQEKVDQRINNIKEQPIQEIENPKGQSLKNVQQQIFDKSEGRQQKENAQYSAQDSANKLNKDDKQGTQEVINQQIKIKSQMGNGSQQRKQKSSLHNIKDSQINQNEQQTFTKIIVQQGLDQIYEKAGQIQKQAQVQRLNNIDQTGKKEVSEKHFQNKQQSSNVKQKPQNFQKQKDMLEIKERAFENGQQLDSKKDQQSQSFQQQKNIVDSGLQEGSVKEDQKESKSIQSQTKLIVQQNMQDVYYRVKQKTQQMQNEIEKKQQSSKQDQSDQKHQTNVHAKQQQNEDAADKYQKYQDQFQDNQESAKVQTNEAKQQNIIQNKQSQEKIVSKASEFQINNINESSSQKAQQKGKLDEKDKNQLNKQINISEDYQHQSKQLQIIQQVRQQKIARPFSSKRRGTQMSAHTHQMYWVAELENGQFHIKQSKQIGKDLSKIGDTLQFSAQEKFQDEQNQKKSQKIYQLKQTDQQPQLSEGRLKQQNQQKDYQSEFGQEKVQHAQQQPLLEQVKIENALQQSLNNQGKIDHANQYSQAKQLKNSNVYQQPVIGQTKNQRLLQRDMAEQVKVNREVQLDKKQQISDEQLKQIVRKRLSNLAQSIHPNELQQQVSSQKQADQKILQKDFQDTKLALPQIIEGYQVQQTQKNIENNQAKQNEKNIERPQGKQVKIIDKNQYAQKRQENVEGHQVQQTAEFRKLVNVERQPSKIDQQVKSQMNAKKESEEIQIPNSQTENRQKIAQYEKHEARNTQNQNEYTNVQKEQEAASVQKKQQGLAQKVVQQSENKQTSPQILVQQPKEKNINQDPIHWSAQLKQKKFQLNLAQEVGSMKKVASQDKLSCNAKSPDDPQVKSHEPSKHQIEQEKAQMKDGVQAQIQKLVELSQ